MKDEIVIAQAMDGQIRIHAAITTEMVDRARQAHTCMPTSAAALGRVLTVTAIMASDLKNPKEKIISVFNGGGPAGTVLAQADSLGNVRGFIGDPNIYMVRDDGHLDVGKAVGQNGFLTVTRDLAMRDPFSGSVKIQSGEIGDDFAFYFAMSEQTPSVVGVGVLVYPQGYIQASGGLIYQLMPDASEAAIEACETAARIQKPVSQLVDEGATAEEMIRLYFPDAEIMDHRPVRWYCGCSAEHYFEALQTLPEEDLIEMIEDGNGAEIRCQYCNSVYTYSTDQLKQILEAKRAGDR